MHTCGSKCTREFVQFCYKPTTSLKNKVYHLKNKRMENTYHIYMNLNQARVDIVILDFRINIIKEQTRLFYDNVVNSLGGISTSRT
jgi:hypothetical protein